MKEDKITSMPTSHPYTSAEDPQELNLWTCSHANHWRDSVRQMTSISLHENLRLQYHDQISKTYRVFKFGSCAKNSGSGPVKLLYDKSLKEELSRSLENIYRNVKLKNSFLFLKPDTELAYNTIV